MNNNNPFKIPQDSPALDVSGFASPPRMYQSPNVNINLGPTPSTSFYQRNTPRTPQNLNLSMLPPNNLASQNSMLSNSPYPVQTPAMQPVSQSPINMLTPQINLSAAKSPQNYISFYNAKNNSNLNENNNSNLDLNKYQSSSNIDGANFIKKTNIEPKLQNIVSTANLCCKLNLRQIALTAKNAEYNPKRFAAVIMRIKDPKTTALIFSSGKMVCTGAKSEEESKKAARKFAKIIKSLGFKVDFKEFKVQNIVGSCDIKFKIHLTKLNSYLGGMNEKNKNGRKFRCHYEPEAFPGLIYHMNKPEIVLLIFVSGKIVLTGAKQKNEIFEAFEKIYPVLAKHRNLNKDNITNKDLHKREVEERKALTQTKENTKDSE